MKKKIIVEPEGTCFRVVKTLNMTAVVAGELLAKRDYERWVYSPSVDVETQLPKPSKQTVVCAPPSVDFTFVEPADEPAAPVIRFRYHGVRRVVEAYSIKRAPGTGNLLLHGHEVGSLTSVKAFIIGDMHDVDMEGVKFIGVHA